MFGQRSLEFSIKGGEEIGVPGPASYNIVRDPIVRSVSFNRAGKHRHSRSEIPGPGSYTLKSNLGKAPHAILISRKPEKSSAILPGPADYTPIDTSHKIHYTIPTHTTPQMLSTIPGPGAYESVPISKSSPRATIGKAPRITFTSKKTPGPGSYNPKDFKPGIPKFSFPLTPRSEPKIINVPGPGAYNVELSTNSGKPAVMTPRRPLSAKNEKMPGPGSYNIDKDPFSVPKWTISKAKRNFSQVGKSPSSADYSPKVVFANPAYSIGNAKRNEFVCNQTGPGPGAYETGKDSAAPKFTIAARHESNILEVVPGPGEYNIDVENGKKMPSAVFGTSKKLVSRCEIGPGRADYGRGREKKEGGFSFSREKRGRENSDVLPGPGQYEIPCTIGTARSSKSLSNTFT